MLGSEPTGDIVASAGKSVCAFLYGLEKFYPIATGKAQVLERGKSGSAMNGFKATVSGISLMHRHLASQISRQALILILLVLKCGKMGIGPLAALDFKPLQRCCGST